MNSNVMILNAHGRESHVLCPTTLNQVLCLPRNLDSLISHTVHAMCVFISYPRSRAGFTGEENQVGTSFSLSLSLTDRRFSDMKEAARKERFAVVDMLPHRRCSPFFVPHGTACLLPPFCKHQLNLQLFRDGCS